MRTSGGTRLRSRRRRRRSRDCVRWERLAWERSSAARWVGASRWPCGRRTTRRVGAPLVEELFFRGLLQPRLVTLVGPVPGIVATSCLFGAAHLIAWQGPITLAYALSVAGGGLVLGALRHLSGRLGPSTVAHA